jgi:hypothetical protein
MVHAYIILLHGDGMGARPLRDAHHAACPARSHFTIHHASNAKHQATRSKNSTEITQIYFGQAAADALAIMLCYW